MKLTVLKVFRDKITKEMYSPGNVIDIADKVRAKSVIERGLAEEVKENKKAKADKE